MLTEEVCDDDLIEEIDEEILDARGDDDERLAGADVGRQLRDQ